MAISKCIKCDNTFFEVVENAPNSSPYKLIFVQCARCGAVIGAMDFFNIGTLLNKLEEKVEKISKNALNQDLSIINNSINNINGDIKSLYNLIEIKLSK